MELDSNNVVVTTWPELMTESELIQFLRIPEVSKTSKHDHVIENLKRTRGLPCIHISKQPLYWLPAIRDWLREEAQKNQPR